MPFIHVSTTAKISPQDSEKLKSQLGEAITILPGKSEKWLMVRMEGGCDMYFSGDHSKGCAMVEVYGFGSIPGEAAEKMTARLCEIMDRQLGIASDQTYVKYQEVAQWGWNSKNL